MSGIKSRVTSSWSKCLNLSKARLLHELQFWTHRNNPRRIDRLVAPVIMGLDVPQIHRLLHSRHFVETLEIVRDVGIIRDAPDVALEVPEIDRIEPHQGRE